MAAQLWQARAATGTRVRAEDKERALKMRAARLSEGDVSRENVSLGDRWRLGFAPTPLANPLQDAADSSATHREKAGARSDSKDESDDDRNSAAEAGTFPDRDFTGFARRSCMAHARVARARMNRQSSESQRAGHACSDGKRTDRLRARTCGSSGADCRAGALHVRPLQRLGARAVYRASQSRNLKTRRASASSNGVSE